MNAGLHLEQPTMPLMTLDQLKASAAEKHCPSTPNADTLKRVNFSIAYIEKGDEIKNGDIVIAPYKFDWREYNIVKGQLCRWRVAGLYLRSGYVSGCFSEGGGIYTPFIFQGKHIDLSGGPWTSITVAELKLIERRPARFQDWVIHPESNGAVPFYADVRVWQTDQILG